MTNTVWVNCKDGTKILVLSGSRCLVAGSDPSGVTKQDRMYQYLIKIPGNLNHRIWRMYQQLRKLPGNLQTKLRTFNVI